MILSSSTSCICFFIKNICIVAFVLSIIWFCVSNVGQMYLPSQIGDDLWWKFSMVDNYLSIIPMFFLYIVIFKASLWVYRWRSRHEE